MATPEELAAIKIKEDEVQARVERSRGYIKPAPIPPGYETFTVKHQVFKGLSDLPVFDLFNGDPSEVRPYLQRSTVPEHLKWVKIGNMPSTGAFEAMDAYVKSHLYHLEKTAPDNWTDETKRKAAVVLGVTRAVTHSSYSLTDANFIEGETVSPYLNATWDSSGKPKYTAVVPSAGASTDRDILTNDFVFDDKESNVLKFLVRAALTIVPLQGHNLLVDGHHYLSDVGKSSFKAFLAVERQLLVGSELKAWFDADTNMLRDLLWHKSCHPVAIDVKYRASTSEPVRTSLDAAGIGSATARLPAMETEARTASSYLKMCEVMKSMMEQYDGKINCTALEDAYAAIEKFPHGDIPPASGVQVADGVFVMSRKSALNYVKDMCKRNMDKVALFFGFYTALMENNLQTTGVRGADTLGKAFSLVKLRSECVASYQAGAELYKDYQSAKNKARAAGRFIPGNFVIE